MRILFLFFLGINLFANNISIFSTFTLSEKSNCFRNYKNANYSISVNNRSISVIVTNSPLKVRARYPFNFKQKELKKIIKNNLEKSEKFKVFFPQISGNSRDYYTVVDNILNFVAINFHYSTTNKNPFNGDCNVAANTTVKLLTLAGIPARIKYVVIVKKEKILTGTSLHAIVEIYYPGTGWLLSDPLKYHHFIPSNYVLVNKNCNLLGIRITQIKSLKKEAFIDILKGKTVIYKVKNLFRYF